MSQDVDFCIYDGFKRVDRFKYIRFESYFCRREFEQRNEDTVDRSKALCPCVRSRAVCVFVCV